jgi:DNA-binding PadR family transcriptional regulator
MRRSSHGYKIAKHINDVIGPFAKLSNGRFYPLLAKLEAEGIIEIQADSSEEQQGERQSRRYAITEKGRDRFYRLMLDTTSNPGEYHKIFIYKIPVFDLLQASDRAFLLDHYLNYCQAHLLHLKAEAEDLIHNGATYGLAPMEIEAIIVAMRHLSRQWEVEVEWIAELRVRELPTKESNITVQHVAIPETIENLFK